MPRISVVQGFLGEADAEAAQALVLGPDVVDGELGERDAVGGERVTVGLDGRVTGGLQEQFRAAGVLGGDDGQPPVRLAQGDVVLLHETEDLRVEAEGLGLVVDEDAGEMDLHGVLSSGPGAPRSSHLAVM
ncbi:hypothetical protein GCM10010228_79170 [Streptomyces massasporeus]|nr:hypothetical protein GCM10010228_79170 [Streptomyces massasporeus]